METDNLTTRNIILESVCTEKESYYYICYIYDLYYNKLLIFL